MSKVNNNATKFEMDRNVCKPVKCSAGAIDKFSTF